MNKALIFTFLIVFLSASNIMALGDAIFDWRGITDVERAQDLLERSPELILRPTPDEVKNKPIHLAAMQCSIPLLQLFIDAKADVNAKNYYEQTPLLLASRECSVDVLKFLVENGADASYTTQQDGFTALHFAARTNGGLDVADYLLSLGVNLDASTKLHNVTPVINAIKYGNIELAKHLIDQGADLKIGHPLNEIISMDIASPEVLEYLLENGADINAGYPVVTAMTYGRFELAKYLIEKGAELNQSQALSSACSTGNLEMVKFIVERGGDVNAGEQAPLMAAARSGQLKIVKYLIQSEAEVNAISESGNQTALSLAVWEGHKIVADVLIKNGAKPTVFSDAMLGEIDRMEAYSLQEILDSKDYQGRTPLFAAIIGKQKKIAEYLVSKGADINAKTNIEERSPLHVAVATGHREITRMLLSNGATVNARMSDSLYVQAGFTPMDIAREREDELMIKLLNKFSQEQDE